MSNNNPAPGPNQPISLDTENTPLGAMERAFLVETKPVYKADGLPHFSIESS
jgi:hypothetical protein